MSLHSLFYTLPSKRLTYLEIVKLLEKEFCLIEIPSYETYTKGEEATVFQQ